MRTFWILARCILLVVCGAYIGFVVAEITIEPIPYIIDSPPLFTNAEVDRAIFYLKFAKETHKNPPETIDPGHVDWIEIYEEILILLEKTKHEVKSDMKL